MRIEKVSDGEKETDDNDDVAESSRPAEPSKKAATADETNDAKPKEKINLFKKKKGEGKDNPQGGGDPGPKIPLKK